MLWVLGLGLAWGAGCDKPYAVDSLADDLGVLEAAILGQTEEAPALATKLEADLTCLDGVLPRVIAGRVLRAVASGQMGAHADAPAGDWLLTAAAVDPGFRYTLDDLPSEEHPAFIAWMNAVDANRAVQQQAVAGYVWTSGTFYVDGRRSNWPAAEIGMPHLLQRVHEGRTSTWRVEGNTFPNDLLIADAASAPPPVAGQRPQTPTGRTKVEVHKVKQNNWPTERIALVGGGTAALEGGGALYALAWNQRGKFDASNTRADTERLARSTNTLTVASTATLAAGAGTLGFGILFFIVDGDPRPTLDIRF